MPLSLGTNPLESQHIYLLTGIYLPMKSLCNNADYVTTLQLLPGRAVKYTKTGRMHNELTPVIHRGQLSGILPYAYLRSLRCLCLSVLKKILIPLVCVSKMCETFSKNHNAIHNTNIIKLLGILKTIYEAKEVFFPIII